MFGPGHDQRIPMEDDRWNWKNIVRSVIQWSKLTGWNQRVPSVACQCSLASTANCYCSVAACSRRERTAKGSDCSLQCCWQREGHRVSEGHRRSNETTEELGSPRSSEHKDDLKGTPCESTLRMGETRQGPLLFIFDCCPKLDSSSYRREFGFTASVFSSFGEAIRWRG